jgi:hypothetical protein
MKIRSLFAISVFSFVLSCGQIGESICLIPKDFTGAVIIIFNQKDGLPPEIENGKHVYRIPSSGILKTQVKAKYKIEGHEYYYMDSSEYRIKIPYLFPNQLNGNDFQKNPNEVFCFNEEMGTTAENKPNQRKFRLFLIGKLIIVDSLSNVKDQIVFKALKQ